MRKRVFLAEQCVAVVCVKTFLKSFHDFTEAGIGVEPRKESALSFVCSAGCSYLYLKEASGGSWCNYLEATLNKGKMDREASLCWVWWCSCNPSPGKGEAGGSELEGQPQLHCQFEASLGNMRLFQGEKEQYFTSVWKCFGGVCYVHGRQVLSLSFIPRPVSHLVSLYHMVLAHCRYLIDVNWVNTWDNVKVEVDRKIR